MHTYTVSQILVEADTAHGVAPAHFHHDTWCAGIPVFEGKLRLRPVTAPAGLTLREYLIEAMAAWTSEALTESVGRIVDAARERVGPWVDVPGSTVTVALQGEGDQSLTLVVTDKECRNASRLRVDLRDPTPVWRGRSEREYHLAEVTLRTWLTWKPENPLMPIGGHVTLFRVPTVAVFPVRPLLPEWDETLGKYLRRIGFPEGASGDIEAKAAELVGSWISDSYADLSANMRPENPGSLGLLLTDFEDQKMAEVNLEFRPWRAAPGDLVGDTAGK